MTSDGAKPGARAWEQIKAGMELAEGRPAIDRGGLPEHYAFPDQSQWLFVVDDPDDARCLANSTMRSMRQSWLDVQPVETARSFEHAINRRNVVVLVPAEGPGRQPAIDAIARCRRRASKVVAWEVAGLGSEETPDLANFCERFDLEDVLLADRPWERAVAAGAPEARTANGNGKAHGANGDGNGVVDFTTLTDSELGITPAVEVKSRPTKFLWQHRLPLGEMALIAGEGSVGKSQVLMALAATVSVGGAWPDGGGKAPVGRTVILSAEDSPHKTIIPRLLALGADLSRITLLKALVTLKRDGHDPVVNPVSLRSIAYWSAVLDRLPDTRLLVIDPLPSYLGKGVNDQRNTEVREIIEPFLDLVVAPREICLYCNTHLNKTVDMGNPMHRISGSIAYVNIPRNVHVVTRDKDDHGLRLLLQCKTNNAPDTLPAITFRIESHTLATEEGDIETSRPVWGELRHVDPRTVLAHTSGRGKRGPEPARTAEVAEWLKELLSDGRPAPVSWIFGEGQATGVLPLPIEGNRRAGTGTLYGARNRMSEFCPGWAIEVTEIDLGPGRPGETRAEWRLVPAAAEEAGDQGTETPF